MRYKEIGAPDDKLRLVAGLESDSERAGYEHVIFRPHQDRRLEFARAEHTIKRGRIVSEWGAEGGKLVLHVVVPVNSTATVLVSTDDPGSVGEHGGMERVTPLRTEIGQLAYAVGAGDYTFRSSWTSLPPGPSAAGKG